MNETDKARFITLITMADKKTLYWIDEQVHEEILQRVQLEAREDLHNGN